MGFFQYCQKQGVQLSIKCYGIDALNGMALGLFSSLVIGLIFKNIGLWTGIEALVLLGEQAMGAMGAAIGVGVAFALHAPALVLFASVVTGLLGATLGGAVGAFVAALFGAECGKLVSKVTPVDIIATPAVTLGVGMLTASVVGPVISQLMMALGHFVMWAVELSPIFMSIVVAIVMGLILTLPISSAAIAISLSLSGLAAGAATVGCAAQMIGFAVMSFRENKWAGLLSQGLGTSMLQMPNIIKNPIVWLPPTLSGAILAPFATVMFDMRNIPIGAGMGTSGLVGQVTTIEAMGLSVQTIMLIVIFHIVAPAILTLLIAKPLRQMGWIKQGDLTLNLSANKISRS